MGDSGGGGGGEGCVLFLWDNQIVKCKVLFLELT